MMRMPSGQPLTEWMASSRALRAEVSPGPAASHRVLVWPAWSMPQAAGSRPLARAIQTPTEIPARSGPAEATRQSVLSLILSAPPIAQAVTRPDPFRVARRRPWYRELAAMMLTHVLHRTHHASAMRTSFETAASDLVEPVQW
jgi:hypothetical protein